MLRGHSEAVRFRPDTLLIFFRNITYLHYRKEMSVMKKKDRSYEIIDGIATTLLGLLVGLGMVVSFFLL